jgi:hypothetical protein
VKVYKEERASVLVTVALVMPVLLLFLALIIDAGNWFTHERQLRNRAVAAAQAAGVEYGRQWARCTTGTPLQKAAAELAIIDATKSYAGVNFNSEITNVLEAGIVVSPGIGNLCVAPPLVRSANVKVTEQGVDSLFASFGLPLGGQSEEARIDLLRAASDTGFVPLAIEDQRIVKVQARFFNGCSTDPDAWLSDPIVLTQSAAQTEPGMTLWSSPVTITLPSDGSSGFGCASSHGPRDYEPVAVELRIASRDEVDLNDACDTLIARPFAECYRGVTQVRTWAQEGSDGVVPSGDAPRIYDVAMSGPSCAPDPYYARLDSAATNCTLSVTATMNWLHNPPPTECEAWLIVNGSQYQMAGPCGEGEWVGSAVLSSPGKDEVGIRWIRTWTVGRVDGTLCTIAVPCVQEDTTWVHRTNLADDPATDASPTDIVRLVELTYDPGGLTQVHSERASGQSRLFYFTVGLKTELAPTQFAALRTRFGNRALVCDPDYLNGQTETMFVKSCKPPHAPNPLDGGFWWSGTTCPGHATWFSGPPYTNPPWRCVRTEEQTASSTEQLARGIAFRTGNCANSLDPNATTCSVVQCNMPNRYDEYFTDKSTPINLTDRRFVKVYVVPFGGFKGPADGAVPVLDIAHFYVTGWGALDPNLRDQCAGNENQRVRPGRIAGYFVSTVSPNTGPAEPSQPCDPASLRPCRAVLVR